MGIVRPQTLGQHILNSRGLHHCADSAASDNSSSIGRGFKDDVAGAESAGHFKWYRPVHHRNSNQILLCLLQTLSYRFRHFIGLAHSIADNRTAVPDDDKRTETET